MMTQSRSHHECPLLLWQLLITTQWPHCEESITSAASDIIAIINDAGAVNAHAAVECKAIKCAGDCC